MSDFELSADTRAIEQLADQIGMLGQKQFLRGMMQEMGEAALELVDDEFARSYAPNGNVWKPRTREYDWPILVKTGALRRSMRAKVTPEGFVLYTLRKYAPFHQNGTRKMVARPFFPTNRPPAHWLFRFDQIADKYMRRLLPRAA